MSLVNLTSALKIGSLLFTSIKMKYLLVLALCVLAVAAAPSDEIDDHLKTMAAPYTIITKKEVHHDGSTTTTRVLSDGTSANKNKNDQSIVVVEQQLKQLNEGNESSSSSEEPQESSIITSAPASIVSSAGKEPLAQSPLIGLILSTLVNPKIVYIQGAKDLNSSALADNA